jgi:hypothetical protein
MTLKLTENPNLEAGAFYLRSRGYLPHYEAAGHTQLNTYRLQDSLPAAVLAKLDEELDCFDYTSK